MNDFISQEYVSGVAKTYLKQSSVNRLSSQNSKSWSWNHNRKANYLKYKNGEIESRH